ncbi:MAG: hypothetical protein GOV02_00530 [Candidatus Aenigmarchaeota archaeon]|nr:hypothetical protein [Candidatus Aenigmarchaeota archaeon]
MALKKEINFARNNKFRYQIVALPILTAMTQSIDIEAITLAEVQAYNPVLDLKIHGEKMVYSNLDVSFLIDENYDVFTEIYNFTNVAVGPYSVENTRNENYTDIVIDVYDNNSSNIVRKFIFEDCWINTIGNLSFDSTAADTPLSTATFVYQSFRIEPYKTDTTGFTNHNYSKIEQYPPDPFET